jgi:uncharacterized SAM-binding protein YcdF (DUF218 family)
VTVIEAGVPTEHPPEQTPTKRPSRRRWWVALGVVLTLFVVATGRLFAIPHNQTPSRADAIIVLGGRGHRLAKAAELAHQGVAPVLVVSDGITNCPRKRVPGIPIVCFMPDPFTTQGEARSVEAMARSNGWHHLVVVTSTDQRTRAMLRFGRCTNIKIDYVTTPLPWQQWPWLIAYQWGALVKALTLQRGC